MKYLFLVFLFFGCGTHEKQSHTKVVNGVETDAYPAVKYIKLFRQNGSIGGCTGTFIKTNLMLTAAHCVDGVMSVEVDGHQAKRIITNSKHSYTYDGLSQDFALLKFSKNISRHTLPISYNTINHAQSLTLIGYGLNNYIPFRSGAGVKRIGFNVYLKNHYLERGIIQFDGVQQPQEYPYTNASVGQGDSGGPLLSNGMIVGVASAQYLYNKVNSSYYAATGHNNFTDFMTRASNFL